MKKHFLKFFIATLVFITLAILLCQKTTATGELSDEKLTSISNHCSVIKDNLKNIQHEDSRIRVHLGSYYSAILSDFITPLNIALVNNNISNISLIESQTNFVAARAKFASDYINYQKDLEELVSIDCTTEPARFYNKLIITRNYRTKVADDVVALNDLVKKQIKLVTNLKESL
jgi:hypothetical protein